MSVVLIDRELLEALLDEGPRSVTWAAQEQVRSILAARPAETEGVLPDRMEVAPYQTVDRGSVNYRCGWNACRKEAIAALSAVTAERDRMKEEMGILWKKLDKFDSQSHGITALAEIERLRAERDRLRALIAECAEYLNTDRETTIGSGSILHRQMIAAMVAKEA